MTLGKKGHIRTHSASVNYALIVVEYAVQHLEAGVNVSDIVLRQNVTPAKAKTVFHINEALIAAQRGAEQQADTHKPQSRCAHFMSIRHNNCFCVNSFYSNLNLLVIINVEVPRFYIPGEA